MPSISRERRGLLAWATVVFVAIAGSVIGILELHQWHSRWTPGVPPSPGPTVRSCSVQAPASWQQAIADGTFSVNRSSNEVISANGGTGNYLVVQKNEPANRTSSTFQDVRVALFRGGASQTIYIPNGSNEDPRADRTGAISSDWVTFAIGRPGFPNAHKVLLYERARRAIITVAEVPDQQPPQRKVFVGAPVIAAGKVYWLARVYLHPETTTLDSWDPARGSAAGSVPAAYATGLVAYGSGVALLKQFYGWHSLLSNGAGTPLSPAQLADSWGHSYGFDGISTLSWLRTDGGSADYSSLVVGGTGVRHQRLTREPTPGGLPATYPFTQAEGFGPHDGMLDLRTDTVVALPAGLSLKAMVGGNAIFGTGPATSGAAGLSIVAVSALPPVRC